jgi:anti-anti-sigma regulatory factor
MTCKIERLESGGSKVVLRVCGRIQVEHAGTIEELIGEECHGVILDLTEVMLVDRDVVTFLAACERKGVELKNCPAFLQEWIAKEQLHPAADCPH